MGAEQLRALFDGIQMNEATFHFRAYTRLKQLEHLLSSGQVDDLLYWRQGTTPVAAQPFAREIVRTTNIAERTL